MIVAEQSLISKQPHGFVAFITLSHKYAGGRWREIFRADSWVKSINEEGMELPMSFCSVTSDESETTLNKPVSNFSHGDSDIPSLNLGHRTAGYQCKGAPLVPNPHPTSTESDPTSSKEQSPKRLDPRTAALEIIELSNSRIGNYPSALLYSSLRGDRDQNSGIVDSLTATSGRYGRNRQLISSPVVMALNDANGTSCPEDTVDSFMMLRFSEFTPERKRESEDEDANLRNGGKCAHALTCMIP